MLAKGTDNLELSIAAATGASVDRLLVCLARKVLLQAEETSECPVTEVALIVAPIASSVGRPLVNRIGDPSIRVGDELCAVLLCYTPLYVVTFEFRLACACLQM